MLSGRAPSGFRGRRLTTNQEVTKPGPSLLAIADLYGLKKQLPPTVMRALVEMLQRDVDPEKLHDHGRRAAAGGLTEFRAPPDVLGSLFCFGPPPPPYPLPCDHRTMSAVAVPQEVREGIVDALAERPDRDRWRIHPTYVSIRASYAFTARYDGMLLPARDMVLHEATDATMAGMRKATKVFVSSLLAEYSESLRGE